MLIAYSNPVNSRPCSNFHKRIEGWGWINNSPRCAHWARMSTWGFPTWMRRLCPLPMLPLWGAGNESRTHEQPALPGEPDWAPVPPPLQPAALDGEPASYLQNSNGHLLIYEFTSSHPGLTPADLIFDLALCSTPTVAHCQKPWVQETKLLGQKEASASNVPKSLISLPYEVLFKIFGKA